MNSAEEQPGGHKHDRTCTPEPGTAFGERDALVMGMQPLTPPKTWCVSCFVTELFLSSTQIHFPAKRTKKEKEEDWDNNNGDERCHTGCHTLSFFVNTKELRLTIAMFELHLD
ncbi:UNVERIFIED_CONTAM: hypothetical protein H355_001340 [Colinus virginianus]|nr:hypothetical protein H355_001340 [Colinus virginianus]